MTNQAYGTNGNKLHLAGDKWYDTLNCEIAKEYCDGNCHECTYGDRIEIKPIRISSSTAYSGVTFYNVIGNRDIYAYDTQSGLVIKSRSGMALLPQVKKGVAKAVFEFKALRDKARRVKDINDKYSSDELKEAERIACMG